MNTRDIPGDDTDWIYSSKKLKELQKARNPMDEVPDMADVDEKTTADTLLDRKDPIFNEMSAQSQHEVLKEAVQRSTRLQPGNSKLDATQDMQTDPVDTIKKMAEGKASTEDLRSALHTYDPLCDCNKCSI